MTTTNDAEVADRIRGEEASVQALIARADTKAQALTTAGSLLLAGIVALTKAGVTTGPPAVALAVAAGLVGTAVALLLLVLLPRLGPNPGTGLLAWAANPAEDILHITHQDNPDLAAIQLHKIARIAVRKMRLLQVAIGLTIAGLATVAAAGLL